MFFPDDLSDDQRAEYERIQMRAEAYTAQMRRMIAEMPYDDLELLSLMFGHIANASNSAAIASWYEGATTGALAVRDVRLAESSRTDPAKAFAAD